MKQPIFKGSATALVTPFSPEGELDLAALGRLIDWQLEQGTDGLVVCATTGECATLSDHEWETVVAFAAERAGSWIPVIAGAGRNDTRHTVWLCRQARKLGARALLTVTPYYNKTTQQGLTEHFTTVADETELPILLYNVPSRTGMSFQAETYARLAGHPNIYGVKEASGDFGLILKTRACCPADFALYSGNDDQIVPMLALGGLGVISTMANVVPQETHTLCTRWFTGDREGAAAMQLRLQPLIQALFREINPIPVKAALELMGKCGGRLRQPLTRIGAAAETELRAALRELELI